MLALLVDHDFREPLLTGLLAREPGLDFVRVRDVGLRQAPDGDVLQWAADHGRIVVRHDTLVGAAYTRVTRRLRMPGVIAVAQSMTTGPAIEQLLLVIGCYESAGMDDKVIFLPL